MGEGCLEAVKGSYTSLLVRIIIILLFRPDRDTSIQGFLGCATDEDATDGDATDEDAMDEDATDGMQRMLELIKVLTSPDKYIASAC